MWSPRMMGTGLRWVLVSPSVLRIYPTSDGPLPGYLEVSKEEDMTGYWGS